MQCTECKGDLVPYRIQEPHTCEISVLEDHYYCHICEMLLYMENGELFRDLLWEISFLEEPALAIAG